MLHAFIKVGLWKDEQGFAVYSSHKKAGSIKREMLGSEGKAAGIESAAVEDDRARDTCKFGEIVTRQRRRRLSRLGARRRRNGR